MSQPPHRVLSVALRIFSVLLAIGGLFMISGSRGLVIRVFLHPPETEVSTLLLFVEFAPSIFHLIEDRVFFSRFLTFVLRSGHPQPAFKLTDCASSLVMAPTPK